MSLSGGGILLSTGAGAAAARHPAGIQLPFLLLPPGLGQCQQTKPGANRALSVGS